MVLRVTSAAAEGLKERRASRPNLGRRVGLAGECGDAGLDFAAAAGEAGVEPGSRRLELSAVRDAVKTRHAL